MTRTLGRSWESMGWSDPAPGDVGGVRALEYRFRRRADDLRALNVELTQGLTGLEAWEGDAARQFRASQQRLRTGLDEFVLRFDECAAAMARYADDLGARQHDAGILLTQLLDARRRLTEANHTVVHGATMEARWNAYHRAQAAVQEITEIVARHAGLHTAHDADVARCGHRLQDSDGTVLQDLWRDTGNVIAAGERTLDRLGAEADRWVRENANAINAVTDVLSTISTVVGVAALVVPVGGPVVVIGLALAVAAGRGLAYQGGAKGVTSDDVVQDAGAAALSIVGFGVAKHLGHTAGVVASRGGFQNILTGHRIANVGLAVQHGNDAIGAVGAVSGTPDTFRDIKQYWTPRNPVQAGLYAHPTTSVPALTAVPFWNAVQDGHRLDLEARQDPSTSPAFTRVGTTR